MNSKTHKQNCCHDCKNGHAGTNQSCRARIMVESIAAAASKELIKNQITKTDSL